MFLTTRSAVERTTAPRIRTGCFSVCTSPTGGSWFPTEKQEADITETREFSEIRAELQLRIEALESALRPLADQSLDWQDSTGEDEVLVGGCLTAGDVLRARDVLSGVVRTCPLPALVPPAGPVALSERLREALKECVLYHTRGWRYWFRQASMLRLEELGLVEEWRPEQISGAPRRKKLPWRPTVAGIEHIRGLEAGDA